MKVISYSLFGDPKSFEFNWYLRGIYFNTRMNQLLYPEWATVMYTHLRMPIFDALAPLLRQSFLVRPLNNEPIPERCAGMLWRFKPFFNNPDDITHVICRDADAVTTYREAVCVKEWMDSGLPFHAINDNPAHGGLMGGMVGFRTEDFKRATGYTSFEQMISGLDLTKHGSDQNFMMKSIHPKVNNQLLMHVLSGGGCEAAKTIRSIDERKDIGIDKRLWESSNTCRFIGSPGVVDFELLRFFKRFDNDPKFDKFEKQFPDIFYWQR